MKSLVPINTRSLFQMNGILNCGFNRVVMDYVRRYSGPDDSKAGSIKEAGGVFKQMGTAREDQFFYNKEKELIENIRQHMEEQIEFHEEQIAKHKQAIEKIRKKQQDMK